jgi:hypothetical protein
MEAIRLKSLFFLGNIILDFFLSAHKILVLHNEKPNLGKARTILGFGVKSHPPSTNINRTHNQLKAVEKAQPVYSKLPERK